MKGERILRAAPVLRPSLAGAWRGPAPRGAHAATAARSRSFAVAGSPRFHSRDGLHDLSFRLVGLLARAPDAFSFLDAARGPRAGGMRRWRQRCRIGPGRAARGSRQRSCVVELRSRRPARRDQWHRHAGPRPHRLVDPARPRAAARQWRAADPLRLARHHRAQHLVLPVKTTPAAAFRIEARSGGNGGLIWTADSDYVMPPHNWVPSYNVTLDVGQPPLRARRGRQAAVRTTPTRAAARCARSSSTAPRPTTPRRPRSMPPSSSTRRSPSMPRQRVLRLHGDGRECRRSRQRHRPRRRRRRRHLDIGGGAARRHGIDKVAMNSAPALSIDGKTLYVAVNTRARPASASRLPARARQRDARGQGKARADRSRHAARRRASATTAPPRPRSAPTATSTSACSKRTFGAHNAPRLAAALRRHARDDRGRAASAGTTRPRSCRRRWCRPTRGTSSYLLMTKYNNYAGVGAATARTGSRSSTPREPDRPDHRRAGHEGSADHRSARRSIRARSGAVRNGASTPPPSTRDQVDPGQQRGRQSLSLEPGDQHAYASKSA